MGTPMCNIGVANTAPSLRYFINHIDKSLSEKITDNQGISIEDIKKYHLEPRDYANTSIRIDRTEDVKERLNYSFNFIDKLYGMENLQLIYINKPMHNDSEIHHITIKVFKYNKNFAIYYDISYDRKSNKRRG